MDSRFAALHNDPRFARKKRDNKKKKNTEKDDRFAAMETDRDFSVIGDSTTDKYGRRKITKNKKVKDEDDKDEQEDTQEDKKSTNNAATSSKSKPKRKKRGHEDADDRMERLNRLARGEAFSSDYSSSSSDDGDKYEDVGSSGSSDFSSDEDNAFFNEPNSSDIEVPEGSEKVYNENLRKHEAVLTGDESKRLAVVNLDWDRVRAVDLHSLLQSFLSGVGAVNRVTIYPSEFGMQMMKQDEQFGPQGIYSKGNAEDDTKNTKKENKEQNSSDSEQDEEDQDEDDEDDEDDEEDEEDQETGTGVDEEKLRLYEMQKLRYYFGIIECNSIETASSIYNQCDGLEYESSSLVLDLRYVPDEIQFKQAARTTSTHIPESYKPPEYFYSHALQQTNVKLTWDEPEIERKALSNWSNNTNTADKNAYEEQDLRTYLAEASDESEMDEERWSDNGGDDDNDETFETNANTEIDLSTLSKKERKKAKKLKKKLKKERKKKKKEKKKKLKSKYLKTFGMNSGNESNSQSEEDEEQDHRSQTGGLIPDDEYEGLEIKFNAGFGENDGDKELKKKFNKNTKKNKNKDAELSVFARYQQEKKLKRKERRLLKKKEKEENGGVIEKFDDHKKDDKDDFFLGGGGGAFKVDDDNQDFDHNDETDHKNQKNHQQDSESKQQKGKADAELNLLMIPETYGDDRDLGVKAGSNDMTYKKMIQQEKRKGKKNRRKKKDKQEDEGNDEKSFEIDTTDDRFSAMFNEHSYAIDPTDSRYVQTNNMKRIMDERQARRRSEIQSGERTKTNGGVVTVDANKSQRENKNSKRVPDSMLQKNVTESLVETLKRKHAEMKNKNGMKTGRNNSSKKKRSK